MVDILAIKRKTLVKYGYFGSVVSGCKLISTSNIKTASTDGKYIYYNPNFLEQLDENEQVFVLSHEICHVAFNHILRSEGKNTEVWNIATDAVINAFLRKDGLSINGGVDIKDAINYDSEELYNKLLKENQEKQNNQKQKNNNEDEQNGNDEQGGEQVQQNSKEHQNGAQNDEQSQNDKKQKANGNQQISGKQDSQNNEKKSEENSQSQNNSREQSTENSDENHEINDSHKLWEKALKNYKNGKGLSSDFEKEKQEEINKSEDIEKKQDEKRQEKIEGLSKLGEKEGFKKNKIERKKQLEELEEQLAKEAQEAGFGTSLENKELNDIGVAKPLIDWRLYLKEAIRLNADWSFKNAEFEDNVLNAKIEKYPVPETEIMLDVSGSVSETLLKNFLRECKNILQTSIIKVGQFNSQFIDFQEVRQAKDIDNLKFNIGGGTDFNIPVDSFSKRAANKIIFTDGDASMPEKSCNAIWVVYGSRKIYPKGGKVINIDESFLRKLKYVEKERSM
ncbi:MAG: VWA-like domain-containing protein [Clostridia bacterium]